MNKIELKSLIKESIKETILDDVKIKLKELIDKYNFTDLDLKFKIKSKNYNLVCKNKDDVVQYQDDLFNNKQKEIPLKNNNIDQMGFDF